MCPATCLWSCSDLRSVAGDFDKQILATEKLLHWMAMTWIYCLSAALNTAFPFNTHGGNVSRHIPVAERVFLAGCGW